jgi:hypothetical protein
MQRARVYHRYPVSYAWHATIGARSMGTDPVSVNARSFPIFRPTDYATYSGLLAREGPSIVMTYEQKFALIADLLSCAEKAFAGSGLAIVCSSVGLHGVLPRRLLGDDVIFVNAGGRQLARAAFESFDGAYIALISDTIRCDPLGGGANRISILVRSRCLAPELFELIARLSIDPLSTRMHSGLQGHSSSTVIAA